MDHEPGDELRRPIPVVLAGIAAIGWLSAAFLWWEASETESQIAASLRAAEQAREALAADLQNLQKTAGTAADLKKQAADAEKALSEAVAARASAQNELADLTKQISDAKLVVSGAQEEAGAKSRDLEAVDARLKEESDRAAALQGQNQALSAEQTRVQGDLDAAHRALAQAQTETAAAQKQLETLQGQINAAGVELNALQAQIRATKSGANPPSGTDAPP
jgi:chromosome segregation ATPase